MLGKRNVTRLPKLRKYKEVTAPFLGTTWMCDLLLDHGAANETRTRMMFPPRDFKSLVSTSSTIAACFVFHHGYIIANPNYLINSLIAQKTNKFYVQNATSRPTP